MDFEAKLATGDAICLTERTQSIPTDGAEMVATSHCILTARCALQSVTQQSNTTLNGSDTAGSYGLCCEDHNVVAFLPQHCGKKATHH